PAKFKRELTEEEIKWLEKSYQNYIRYKNSYLEEG
ncbi:MAG: gamma carbonic anhydrase family protein, partial [Aquificae bacterium]|nr:gamma carbonic anhydrase family protein [Aquificota bacterium]